MSDLQIWLTIGIFVAVIAAIALDLIDMALATMVGVCLMLGAGILVTEDFIAAGQSASENSASSSARIPPPA